jgi:glucose-1-phosphate cytidylyltransferase
MVEENKIMQVVILAGGSGTRLKEMTEFLPKALIPIGGIPIVVHIMRLYAHYGFKDFVLALGYKQEAFKQYFAHFDLINHDVILDIGKYRGERYHEYADQWKVTLVDTGENTLKGGRLKRIEKYIQDEIFMCTYGDGVGDIDISALLTFHKSHGKIATITGVHPTPRFGEIHHKNGLVYSFTEKPQDDECLINGGFMVFNREIFNRLDLSEKMDLEEETLSGLTNIGELMVYHHKGYWSCMDNLSDLGKLQQEWETGKARWKVW